MKLKALVENDIIEAIELAMEESILGRGLKECYDMEVVPYTETTSHITLVPITDHEMRFGELMQFFIMLGRDFLIDADYKIWKKKRDDAINRLYELTKKRK